MTGSPELDADSDDFPVAAADESEVTVDDA